MPHNTEFLAKTYPLKVAAKDNQEVKNSIEVPVVKQSLTAEKTLDITTTRKRWSYVERSILVGVVATKFLYAGCAHSDWENIRVVFNHFCRKLTGGHNNRTPIALEKQLKKLKEENRKAGNGNHLRELHGYWRTTLNPNNEHLEADLLTNDIHPEDLTKLGKQYKKTTGVMIRPLRCTSWTSYEEALLVLIMFRKYLSSGTLIQKARCGGTVKKRPMWSEVHKRFIFLSKKLSAAAGWKSIPRSQLSLAKRYKLINRELKEARDSNISTRRKSFSELYCDGRQICNEMALTKEERNWINFADSTS